MSKTFTESERHSLNGSTMATRWSALFYTAYGFNPEPVWNALQAAVDEVDAQMSTWILGSDLMRLNAAGIEKWVKLPDRLMEVLRLSLDIGRASGGAFDIGVGDAVDAWGFGRDAADPRLIRNALVVPRRSAYEVLELDINGGRARKSAPVTFDLNGIAKGYGVDRLAETLQRFNISSGIVGIDGEMRALGLRPDGEPWTVAVESPKLDSREPHSILLLQDASVATSGDYRHWLVVAGRRLSHTMDPQRGAPVVAPPASVTVVARTCAEADAWATALMVLGPVAGAELASRLHLDVLFLLHELDTIRTLPVGTLFCSSRGSSDRKGTFEADTSAL